MPPDAIVTKGGETRVLRLGRDILELYPSTAVAIEQTGPDTSVRLITGTVRVTVAKRKKGQAFNVRTLLLVATVKGTEFEVSATGNGSAVSVYEGRVAVKATGRVGGIDVTPGKTATVTSAEDAPALGPTPAGGAAAAAKALGRAARPARPPAVRMMTTAAAATARTSTPPAETLRAKAPAADLAANRAVVTTAKGEKVATAKMATAKMARAAAKAVKVARVARTAKVVKAAKTVTTTSRLRRALPLRIRQRGADAEPKQGHVAARNDEAVAARRHLLRDPARYRRAAEQLAGLEDGIGRAVDLPRTTGSSNWLSLPSVADRSRGPMNRTSMPSTAAISGIASIARALSTCATTSRLSKLVS